MERKINNAKSTLPPSARAPPTVPRKKPGSSAANSRPPTSQPTVAVPRSATMVEGGDKQQPVGAQKVRLNGAELDELISRRLMELLKQPLVQHSLTQDASLLQRKQQQEQLTALMEAAHRIKKPSSAPQPGQAKPPRPRGKRPEWNDKWASPTEDAIAREHARRPLSRAASDSGRRPTSAQTRGFSLMSSRCNSADPQQQQQRRTPPLSRYDSGSSGRGGSPDSVGQNAMDFGGFTGLSGCTADSGGGQFGMHFGGQFASGCSVYPGAAGGAFAGCGGGYLTSTCHNNTIT